MLEVTFVLPHLKKKKNLFGGTFFLQRIYGETDTYQGRRETLLQ